ncbi:MAG: hypothetical protein WKF58_09075 [Ilumatobacteraceae bacterium]
MISILAKVVGGASSDRVGPVVSARRTGALLTVTGLAWVLLPAGWFVYACAALFAGTVSSLFPVANMVAVDEFGGHGPSLGAYRSAQIGIGALAGWSIGRIGESTSLRATLADRRRDAGAARRVAAPDSDAERRADGARIGGADDGLTGSWDGNHLLGSRHRPTPCRHRARGDAARRRPPLVREPCLEPDAVILGEPCPARAP